jgi:hypothetical protein
MEPESYSQTNSELTDTAKKPDLHSGGYLHFWDQLPDFQNISK